MKIFGVFLIAIVSSQSVLAQLNLLGDMLNTSVKTLSKPIEAGINAVREMGKNVAKTVENVAKNVENIQAGMKTVETIGKNVGNVANNVVSAVQSVGGQIQPLNVITNITGIAENVLNQTNQFQNLANNFVTNFATILSQLQNITNGFLPPEFAGMLDLVRQFLNNIQSQANAQLKSVTDWLQTNVRNNVEMILNQTTDLQVWAANARSELYGSNNQTIGEGIIEDFVDRSNEKIQKCANDTTNAIQDIYNFSHGLTDDTTALGRMVLDGVQICLGGREFILVRIPNCFDRVTKTLFEAGNVFNRRIVPIQSRLIALGVSSAIDWSCIATTRISIEVEKPVIQAEIRG